MRPRMRAPWWLRAFALVFLVCCGCKSSFSEEKAATLSSQLQTDRASQTNETRTVTQGPETDLSLTFGAITNAPMPPLAGTMLPVAAPRPIRLTGKPSDLAAILDALPHGPLIGATLAQKGPSTDASALQVNRATETKAEAKAVSTDDTKKARAPAGLFGGLLALWPLLPVALVGLAIWKRQAVLVLVKRFFL